MRGAGLPDPEAAGPATAAPSEPSEELAKARSVVEQMLLLTDVPTEVSDAALDDLVRAARQDEKVKTRVK